MLYYDRKVGRDIGLTRDPYIVLGVDRRADEATIKQTYRQLAKEYHPDRHPGDNRIAEKFKEISAAYTFLSDGRSRGRYDRGEIDADGNERIRRHSASSQRRPSSQQNSKAAEDFFAEFFKSRRTTTQGKPDPAAAFKAQTSRSPRGRDHHLNLSIEFVEAVRGVTRRLKLSTGKTVDVRVPPGIQTGQIVRLKGLGEEVKSGGKSGDALITIKVNPHPQFRMHGRDIHLEWPIPLEEAMLGKKVTVPTIDGQVLVALPKGAHTGTTLRLKGKGVWAENKQPAGDLYVQLKVILPENPDPELERYLNKWARSQEKGAKTQKIA